MNSFSVNLTFESNDISSILLIGIKWTWTWGTSSPITPNPTLLQTTAFFIAQATFFEKIINPVRVSSSKSKISSTSVFGIHKVSFKNDINEVEFKHEALSRDVFAEGAIEIAKKILKKDPGLYQLEDFFENK